MRIRPVSLDDLKQIISIAKEQGDNQEKTYWQAQIKDNKRFLVLEDDEENNKQILGFVMSYEKKFFQKEKSLTDRLAKLLLKNKFPSFVHIHKIILKAEMKNKGYETMLFSSAVDDAKSAPIYATTKHFKETFLERFDFELSEELTKQFQEEGQNVYVLE